MENTGSAVGGGAVACGAAAGAAAGTVFGAGFGAGCGTGFTGHGTGYTTEEMCSVSVLSDSELLDAIEGLLTDDPVARIMAGVARDEAVAPFVTVVAEEGRRFRVLDNGLSRGREWGFGEVIFSGDVGYVARFTWIRPRGEDPHQVQTADAVAAVRSEVLFRFAYLYRLRDATGRPVAEPLTI